MVTSHALTSPHARLRTFSTPVRGFAFAPQLGSRTRLRSGQGAELVREPGNPADSLAVSIWAVNDDGKWRIGYLDRGVAARLAPRLDAGDQLEVSIDGWTSEPGGRWLRPVVKLSPVSQSAADPPSSAGGVQSSVPRYSRALDIDRRIARKRSRPRGAGLRGLPPRAERRRL